MLPNLAELDGYESFQMHLDQVECIGVDVK